MRANGDPPSDVLLVDDVYRPYLPRVRPAVLRALTSTVAQSRRKGRPVKVALVASVIDLGNVPSLWDTRATTRAFWPRSSACRPHTDPRAERTRSPVTPC